MPLLRFQSTAAPAKSRTPAPKIASHPDIAGTVDGVGRRASSVITKLDKPPPARIVMPGGKEWSATPPRGLSYWERLGDILNKEPVQERDRFFMAMLRPLGIEKGKPFTPNQRQQKILTEAALVGEAMAKANTFDKRAGEPYYANARWKLALILDPSQRADSYDQLDERAAWFYEAVTASKAMATKTPGTFVALPRLGIM